MVHDQFSDTYHVILKTLFDDGVLPGFTKSASILDQSEQSELGNTAFADQVNRKFPVHTPEHTLISAGYFFKQSCHQDKTVPKAVRVRLAKAAYAHEVEDEFLQIASTLASGDQLPMEKQASSYGLLVQRHGKTYGKFYAPTIPLLKQAEAHFVDSYQKYPITWRVETCQNLLKQAQQMGVSEMHPVIHAYAGDNVCHSKKAAEEIAKRGYFAKDAQQKKLYLRLAQVIQGEMTTPETLEKVAHNLDLMDRLNDLDRYYGTAFEDPYKTVYNMTVKAAEAAIEIMDVLGNQYTLDELQGVGPELYKRALGDDFLDAISAEGQLSKEAMQAVIPTLPRDEKAILVKHLNQAIEKEADDAELLRSVSGR
jgi:hypothetical protein